MLEKAFNKFPKLNNLILPSDQGWQYQHKYYVNELKKHGITQSMSRNGNCYDNSIMGTFFERLKNEIYYDYEKSYSSFEEFSKVIEEYIDYYNNERIQSKTKWMPPIKYRLASTTINYILCPVLWVHITIQKHLLGFKISVYNFFTNYLHHQMCLIDLHYLLHYHLDYLNLSLYFP